MPWLPLRPEIGGDRVSYDDRRTELNPGPAPGVTSVAGRVFGTIAWLAAIGAPFAFFVLPDARSSAPAGMVELALVTTVYAATRLSVMLARGLVRPIVSVFFLFMYVSMGIVPLAQTFTGIYPFLISTSMLVPTQFMALTAMVCFDAGQFLLRPNRARNRERRVSLWDRDIRLSRLTLLTLFAVVASLYYMSVVGVASLFASRFELGAAIDDTLRSGDSEVGASLVRTFGTVPAIIVLAAWTQRLFIGRENRTIGGWVAWLLLLSVNVVVNNPISNARYWFLTVAIGLLFCLPRVSSWTYRTVIAGGAIAAIVVFPYTDYFRVSAESRGAIRVTSIAESISSKDFDQSIMSANALGMIQDTGHTLGYQLLSALLFWVPRSVWPTKGIDTGTMVGEWMVAQNTNLSSPLWIELFIDFGWVGVIAGFLILGYLAARGDRYFNELRIGTGRLSRSSPGGLVVPFLAGYTFILLRGPLLQAMAMLAVIVGMCWLLGVGHPAGGRHTHDRPERERVDPQPSL